MRLGCVLRYTLFVYLMISSLLNEAAYLRYFTFSLWQLGTQYDNHCPLL